VVNNDINGIIEYAAARFRNTSADPDDVRQEAWAIALTSKGGVSADILRKKLGNRISRWFAVTSGGTRLRDAGGLREIRVSDERKMAQVIVDVTPETILASGSRQAWRAEVVEAVRKLAGNDWEVVRRLYGLGGCERQRAAGVAKELALPVRRVVHVSHKFRKRLAAAPQVKALWSRREETA
jgi:hypothetical protein